MDKIYEYLKKIKGILTKHDTRIRLLEERIRELEYKLEDPYKMPFD